MDRSQVPEIPPKVRPHVDDRGDKIYDHGRKRWRVREGKLIFYCEYHRNTAAYVAQGLSPWLRRWCAPGH